MRVLLTCHPATSHFHTMGPLARTAVENGWEVAFATAESFSGEIETAGFRVFPCGLDWFEGKPDVGVGAFEYRALLDRIASRSAASVADSPFVKEMFASLAAARMVPELVRLIGDWKPDLLLRSSLEHGAAVASELTGVPCVVVEALNTVRFNVDAELAHLRETMGLPIGEAWMRRMWEGDGYLTAWPDALRGMALPEGGRIYAYDPFDTPGPVPEWFDRPASEPLVLTTLGTVMGGSPVHRRFSRRSLGELYDIIAEGLSSKPVRHALTVGPNGSPVAPREDNRLFAASYLPHSAILPRCSVVISHGGIGSLVKALFHGLPVLVIPLGADNPENAKRVVEAGCGMTLAADALTAADIGASVDALLTDPKYRARARAIAVELRAAPPASAMLPFLEEVAHRRRVSV